jgi:hypothetical protein
VDFEDVKNPSKRLIQVRQEERLVAVQVLDEHAQGICPLFRTCNWIDSSEEKGCLLI